MAEKIKELMQKLKEIKIDHSKFSNAAEKMQKAIHRTGNTLKKAIHKTSDAINKTQVYVINHKKRCIVTGVTVIVVLTFGWVMFYLFGGWTKGGASTSAPYRCRLRGSHTVEVRVSTEKLKADGFTILTDDSKRLKSKLKSKSGSEQVYRLSIGKKTDRVSWSLGYYADKEAKERDERSYVLTVDIVKNEKGKYVVSASAGEKAAVNSLKTDTCEVRYQLEGSYVELELTKPENIHWSTEYDNKILSVEDLFAGDSTTTATIRSVAKGEWNTTVTFYDYYYGANQEEVRDAEITLRLKGTGDNVTEVKLKK